MKPTSFIITNIIALAMSIANAQSLKLSDKQNWGVTGNVTSVHETWYNVVKEGEQLIKGKKIFDKFEIESKVSFNKNGNKIEDVRFDMSGNPSFKLTYSYDDKMNCATEYRYNMDGSLVHQTNFGYKYDNSGKITEVANLNEDGSIKGKTLYKYDSKGNLSEKKWSNQDGTSKIKMSFVCDYKGNIISETNYNSKGKIDWKTIYSFNEAGKVIEKSTFKNGTKFYGKYTYAYDDKGNKTEMHWFKKDGKPYMNWTYKYNYDTSGNWTKQVQYNGEKAISITERVIEYISG